jgi:2-polyprenyl-6-methoxyphenol hydroxylase-like FAD-dependent oxidoreductase
MAPATVLISGSGIAGPALAYWLARRGHRPVLVERTDGLRTGGHAVDIRGTALEVVERMGLDGKVREARTHLMTLSAVRPDGRRTYDVALRPMHEMRGDREIEIMRDDLVRILYTAICDDVEVVFDDSVRTLVSDGDGRVGVEFERGASREVDLVVGADGQHSSIRELVFGPEERFACHLGAYLSIFTVDNLLGLADQAVLYNEPGRAAAMFTVRGNRRAKALLLFRSEPLGIDFRNQAAQQALLRQRTAGMGWQTDRLVDAMADAYDFYFDEMSQIRLPSWSAGRVALLGDAAFGPSPLSGQGTSLAFIGAHLLAHHISTSPDIRDALALWEYGFRPNVEQNQRLATDGMATLLPASRLGIFARNQTMRVLPILARLGRGFGGRIERASRAISLPPDP